MSVNTSKLFQNLTATLKTATTASAAKPAQTVPASNAGNAGAPAAPAAVQTAAPAVATTTTSTTNNNSSVKQTIKTDVKNLVKDAIPLINKDVVKGALTSGNLGQLKNAIDLDQLTQLGSYQKLQSDVQPILDKTVAPVLDKRPLAPTDVNMFSSAAFPNATPMAPAAGPKPTQTQVSTTLNNYLKEQYPLSPSSQQAGMDLFNNPAAQAKISDPSLRAAMVGLMGTAGEPAIDHILNGKLDSGLDAVKEVKWDDQNVLSGNAIGASLIDNATGQSTFYFNTRYQNENPMLFTSTMAHEALHSDANIAGDEELVASAIDNTIYLEQIARHPDLASGGTELTRRLNTNAMARLNSGDGTELSIYNPGNTKPILPGSVAPFTSWAQQYQNVPNQGVSTPGNPLLQKMLTNIAEPGKTPPANAAFNQQTLQFIDQNNANLSGTDLYKAAKALKLNTNVV